MIRRSDAGEEQRHETGQKSLTFNQPVEIPGKVLPGYDGPSGRVGRYAHHVRRAAGWRPISDQEVVLSR
jgi:hypothetical protein